MTILVEQMEKKKINRPKGKNKRYMLKETEEEMKRAESELWERQPGETTRAYQMFLMYRDMPNRRIVDGSIQQHFKVSLSNVFYHSSTYRWKERSRAWDNFLEKKKQEAILRSINEMTDRHAKHAMAIETGLLYPVKEYLEKLKSIDKNDLKSMTASQLFKFVCDAAEKLPKIIDIERKSRGVPNDFNKLDITSDGEQIQPVVNITVKGSKSPLLNNQDSEDE